MNYASLKYQVKEDYARKNKRLKRRQERRADRIIALGTVAVHAETGSEWKSDGDFRKAVENRVRASFGPILSVLFSALIRRLIQLLIDRISTGFLHSNYQASESKTDALADWAADAEGDL